MNRDARQARAAKEGKIPDADDAIRDCDACQAAAASEGVSTDASDTIRNRDTG